MADGEQEKGQQPAKEKASPVADVKKGFPSTSKEVEDFLELDFIQALQDLSTAFSLPDASISLSKCLRKWRKDVERFFPLRSKAQIPQSEKGEGPQQLQPTKENTAGHLSSRILSKAGIATRRLAVSKPNVEEANWESFADSCKSLFDSLEKFCIAIQYLSLVDFLDMECKSSIASLMSTIIEIRAAVNVETDVDTHLYGHSVVRQTPDDEHGHAALLIFVRARLEICQIQLQHVHNALVDYMRTQIPRIRHGQKRSFEALDNVTQVSTFFAGVVASTLQFSVSGPRTVAFVIINTLWLTSLVLGIGSAFNSLLAMTMRKVVSSTPLHAQPWYISFWIRRSYAMLLIIAVILYILGLGVYVITTQQVVAATTTCVVAGLCAAGVFIVSSKYLKERLTTLLETGHVKPRVETKGSNEIRRIHRTEPRGALEIKPVQRTVTRDSEDSRRMHRLDRVLRDEEFFRHLLHSVVRQKDTEMMGSNTSEYKRAPRKLIEERDTHGQSTTYISCLKNVKRRDIGIDLLKDFKHGPIEHMRCSPRGDWVAVCYESACILYHALHATHHYELSPDENEESAEHAEWLETEDELLLLTRTKKKLRLWEVPRDTGSTGSFNKPYPVEVEVNFHLPKDHYKYIKWVDDSAENFLLLTKGTELYIVNRKDGLKEEIKLELQPNFKVAQLFPLSPDLHSIVCLATLSMDEDTTDMGIASDGVDYLFVMHKDSESESVIHFDFHRSWRTTSRVKQRKLLPRKVINVKICKEHRFLLINYVATEVGTFAPELWMIKDDDDKASVNITSSEVTTPMVKLPAPTTADDADDPGWGEASFAGRAHDIILCEVKGTLIFYQFDRTSELLSPQVIYSLSLDFGGFRDPIFTWGDTAQHPLLFVTDADGFGSLSMWTEDKKLLDADGWREGQPQVQSDEEQNSEGTAAD